MTVFRYSDHLFSGSIATILKVGDHLWIKWRMLTLSPVDSRSHKAHINLYGLIILGVNMKYRLFCTSLPPYGGYTGERVNGRVE